MGFRIVAGVCFILSGLMSFGWIVSQDTSRAVGLIAAGLLALVLSTIPVGSAA